MDMILDTRDRLEQGRKSEALISNVFLAIIAISTLSIGVFEFTGALATGGVLTLGYFIFLCFTGAGALHRRGKASASASLGAHELLKEAIKRAENALMNARAIYSCFPIGLVTGTVYGINLTKDRVDTDALSGLASFYPSAGIIMFLFVILAGSAWLVVYSIRLAGRKKIELKELRARLVLFEAEEREA